VTQVRFDEALHEFTTINGVKEDVTDVILNLKDLLLRSDNDDSVVIRLDKSGPADVTAADFTLPTGVEILNEELHIATVNASGRLAVDVTVDRGVGYVSADRNKRSNIIGVVPVDSIFSPVRRCTYTVEPVRVEQSTDYDRIVLDIETDGTISPREALASAGATLSALVGIVASLDDEPQALELGDSSANIGVGSEFDSRIEDLGLTERARNCLKRAGINSIGELLACTEKDLLQITNFGQTSLKDVTERLEERGLDLRAEA
jgi:DNA-directed RNA polymerase subunit alpha